MKRRHNELKKQNTMLDMRKLYVDVSSIVNKYFKDSVSKKKVVLCISELTLLEIKNEKIYKGIPNEVYVEGILENIKVLKVNNKILKLAKLMVDEGIIPKEQYNDALHISIAKYYRCYSIMYDKSSLKRKNIDFSKI